MQPERVEDVAKTVLDDRPDAFLDFVARVLDLSPEQLSRVQQRLQEMHDDLRRTFVSQFKEVLRERNLDVVFLSRPDGDHAAMAEVKQHFISKLLQRRAPAPSPMPLTPELREWARGLHTEAEIVAGLQEARRENGPELSEAIRRLEQGLGG